MNRPTSNIATPLVFGQANQHNLLDVLDRLLSRFPKARNKKIASSTTNRAARIFRINNSEEDRLIGLVYCPRLIDSTVDLAAEKASQIILKETMPYDITFMTYISPSLSVSYCPPELFSEYDSREYTNAGLIRPTLAAMHIVAAGGPPTTFHCTDSSTDYYVTSGFQKGGKGPIPDGFLVKGPYINDLASGEVEASRDIPKEYICVINDETAEGREDDNLGKLFEEEEVKKEEEEEGEESFRVRDGPNILMTIEVKSSNALTPTVFQDVLDLKHLEEFRDSLIINFDWPNEGPAELTKCTKMVAQISEQMFHHEVENSWLTSGDVNIFFHMKKGTRILYMSDQYDQTNMTPLLVYAWFCRATGLITADLDLPEPDFTYYDKVDRTKNGLMAKAVYEALKKEKKSSPTNDLTPKVNQGLKRKNTSSSLDTSSEVDLDVSDEESETPRPRRSYRLRLQERKRKVDKTSMHPRV